MPPTARWLLLSLSLGACIPPPEATPEPPAAPATAPKSAQEVLDRHVVALGGEAALRKQPERRVEGRVVFRAHPACENEKAPCVDGDLIGRLVLYATADGRLFRRMVVDDRVNERGFDGTRGWTLIDGELLELEGTTASLASREDALLHWYLDLDARSITPELVEPVNQGHDGSERVMDGLRWQADHGKLPARTMWFDRATGLLREEVEEGGEDDKMVIVYDDYRPVDGVLVAHAIHQLRFNGDEHEDVDILVQSAEHSTVPASSFAIPELEDPEPAPDPLLAALDEAAAAARDAPKQAMAHLVHARVAFAAGHFETARDAADATLKIDRSEPEAAFIAGRARLLLGDLKGSKRDFDRAIQNGLRAEVYALQMAWLFSMKFDWEKVAVGFETAGIPDLADLYTATPDRAYRLERTRACESTIPAYREPDTDRVAVEVEIEGTPARLMVDTGTRDLLLGETFSGSVLVTRETDAPLGTGGPSVPHAYLESVGIGEFELQNVPAAIVPDNALNSIASGIDGVIGVRPLMRFLTAIDGPAGELRLVLGDRRCTKALKSERSGPSAPLYIHESHYVYTRATMGPSEGVLTLNTGMSGADVALNSGAYARAGVGAPPILDGIPMPATLPDMKLGTIELSKLDAAYGVFENEITTDQFRIDGLVGMHALGGRRVVLDFPGRTIYARPSAAPPATDANESKPAKATP